MITLDTELGRIRGLNPSYVLRLRKLNLKTVRDLLWHFPFRYDDFSQLTSISNLSVGEVTTISGRVEKIALRKSWKRHISIVEAVITDETGAIKAVWFNQPYIARVLRAGMRVRLAGKVSLSDGELHFSNPSYEPVRAGMGPTHTEGLVPIYPETRGITSRGIRYIVKPILKVLSGLPDILPESVRAHAQLPDITHALRMIHFPQDLADADQARRRFSFEDIFLIQLRNLSMRARLQKERAPVITLSEKEKDSLFASLPFTLTASQADTINEIYIDLEKGIPMNRLLQGDVGSGKTAVVALAAFAAHTRAMQTMFMAPTEVLARQHYATIGALAIKNEATIGLLLGGEARIQYADGLETKLPKKKLLEHVANGSITILIGTHALLNKPFAFPALALVVVDEQHRFGVAQRAAFSQKKAGGTLIPHFLSMSATPIPRTLSLTVFGDLDVSIIDELPHGRKPIVTKIVAPENRANAYAFIRGEVHKGRQVFVICPRIETSADDKQSTTYDQTTPSSSVAPRQSLVNAWSEVKTVTDEFEKLSKKIFPDLRVAMLHGKMKSREKTDVMEAMKKGACDILVSTSVIEVGVDIPNANVMIIEGAEYFGLAQLYQFRGRIGRGEHRSYCLLFTAGTAQTTKSRLDALLKAKNGFELAELDLKLRGPGEFLGEKQTGLPDTAMKALTDLPLIKLARGAAEKTLTEDPELTKNSLLRERLSVFEKTLHLE